MIVEKQMECRLAGETEILGEKPAPAPLLSITKSHMTRPGFEPGPPWWEYSQGYGRAIQPRLHMGLALFCRDRLACTVN
jgi:hypothetical protein